VSSHDPTAVCKLRYLNSPSALLVSRLSAGQTQRVASTAADGHSAVESDGGRARMLLQGHTSTVYALVAAKTRPLVFSGSYDRTIKVSSQHTAACKGLAAWLSNSLARAHHRLVRHHRCGTH
jgi:hypothetical protein